MPPRRSDNDDERRARIDMLLEELRLNTEDLHELANQARERAERSRKETRQALTNARRRDLARKAKLTKTR
jgi:hypothetical protein